MQKKQTENILLTIREVAQQLRVDHTTVRRWINDGLLMGIKLPASRQGGYSSYRVPKSAIDAILNGHQQK